MMYTHEQSSNVPVKFGRDLVSWNIHSSFHGQRRTLRPLLDFVLQRV